MSETKGNRNELKLVFGVLAGAFALGLYGLGAHAVTQVILIASIAASLFFAVWMFILPLKTPLLYIHEFLKENGVHQFIYGAIAFAFLMTGGANVLMLWTHWAYPPHPHAKAEELQLHPQETGKSALLAHPR